MKEKRDVTEKERPHAEIDCAIDALIALRKGRRLNGVSWKALRDVGRR